MDVLRTSCSDWYFQQKFLYIIFTFTRTDLIKEKGVNHDLKNIKTKTPINHNILINRARQHQQWLLMMTVLLLKRIRLLKYYCGLLVIFVSLFVNGHKSSSVSNRDLVHRIVVLHISCATLLSPHFLCPFALN